jgi:hypothetical protein
MSAVAALAAAPFDGWAWQRGKVKNILGRRIPTVFGCRIASRVWVFVKYDETENRYWIERRDRNKNGVDMSAVLT